MAIGVPMVQPWVCDYSMSRPGAATLKAAGCVGVMRYVFPNRNDGACITAEEIADFNANSLPYGLVMEAESTWILRGYQSGHDLAVAARQIEQSLGIPAGVTFAAADFDVQPGQFQQALTTLHGMADGNGGWQYVGAYGSSQFCDWLAANSPIAKFWSTDAWSGGYVSPHSALHQRATAPSGTPADCDYNDILGDWAPRTMEDDLTPDEHNVLYTCAKAIVQLGGAITQLQAAVAKLATDEGVRAALIEHGDATHNSIDSLAAAVKAMPSGGSVDPGPIVDGVVSGVKGVFAKAAS